MNQCIRHLESENKRLAFEVDKLAYDVVLLKERYSKSMNEVKTLRELLAYQPPSEGNIDKLDGLSLPQSLLDAFKLGEPYDSDPRYHAKFVSGPKTQTGEPWFENDK